MEKESANLPPSHIAHKQLLALSITPKEGAKGVAAEEIRGMFKAIAEQDEKTFLKFHDKIIRKLGAKFVLSDFIEAYACVPLIDFSEMMSPFNGMWGRSTRVNVGVGPPLDDSVSVASSLTDQSSAKSEGSNGVIQKLGYPMAKSAFERLRSEVLRRQIRRTSLELKAQNERTMLTWHQIVDDTWFSSTKVGIPWPVELWAIRKQKLGSQFYYAAVEVLQEICDDPKGMLNPMQLARLKEFVADVTKHRIKPESVTTMPAYGFHGPDNGADALMLTSQYPGLWAAEEILMSFQRAVRPAQSVQSFQK